MSGDMLISPQVTVRLLSNVLGRRRPVAEASDAALSSREQEIARHIAMGKTNSEIAADLYITPGTVKTHVANIVDKLGVRNRVGIAAWAWEHGIAHPRTGSDPSAT